MSYVLRSHQVRARKLAREAYVAGKRAILYVAPTGAGKTVILADTIGSHLRHHASPRVNVYAHRRELLSQAARTFRAFGFEVGVFGEGARAPVQVVSTQGALSRGEVNACTLAVFDEAHHYAAPEYGTLVAVHRDHGAVICGATATPERADGRGLNHMFDALVVVAQPRELVASGDLVPIDVIGPRKRVPKGKIAQTPVGAYLKFAPRSRAVVFAPTVAAAEVFASEFGGATATVVHGELKADVRDRRFADFASGRVRVLVNVMIATEGWDAPFCDCAIIARDVGSTTLAIQMAGRIARPAPGKQRAILIDLRGSFASIGHPQQDWEYSLDGLGVVGSESASSLAGERLCKICKHPLDDQLVCTSCGRDHTPGTPSAANIELERWAGKRAEDDEARARQLVRWLVKFPGKKPFFYISRYRAVYGHQPPVKVWQRAHELAKGAA